MVARSTKPKAKPKTKRLAERSAPVAPTVELAGDAKPLEALAARMTAACETLERAALEAPKVSDFEPLAEHLYSFAVSAPRLLEGLQDVPKAASTIQTSLASLREVAETLHFSNDRLADAVLKVPRAEDYEPLAAPLREFARVAPALAEALAEVLRVARPLADSVRELPALTEAIRSVRAAAEEPSRSKGWTLPRRPRRGPSSLRPSAWERPASPYWRRSLRCRRMPSMGGSPRSFGRSRPSRPRSSNGWPRFRA